MKLLRIKWENIFAIITGLILVIMTIKYIIANGFDHNVFAFDIVYCYLSIVAVRWTIKASRKMYLNEK